MIKPKIYVIVPVTIPGMEKNMFYSHFQEILKDRNYGLELISIKEIKKRCAEKFAKKKQNKNLSKEEIMQQVEKSAKKVFNQELGELIRKGGSSFKVHFLFIDKNHPKNAFKPTFKTIYESSEGLDLKIVALVPSITNCGLNYLDDKNQKCSYPFSANLFLKCFDTVQQRTDHETLNGKGAESAKVCLYFLNKFKNMNLDQTLVSAYDFHEVFYVPFSDETTASNVPDELVHVLIETLKTSKQDEDKFDDNLVHKLNDVYERLKPRFKEPDADEIKMAINYFLEELFKSKKTKIVNEHIEERKVDEANVQLNYIFRPWRVPKYLGIFPKKFLSQEFKEYILSGFNLLKSTFPKDQIIEEILNSIKDQKSSDMNFVDDPHITTLFIGKNPSKINSSFYKQFHPDERIVITFSVLVIVQEGFVIGLCDPNDLQGKIHDEYPHMTLIKRVKWASKSSINMIEELFKGNTQLREDYNLMFKTSHFVKVINLERPQGSTHKVYIVKPQYPLVMPAETRSSCRFVY